MASEPSHPRRPLRRPRRSTPPGGHLPVLLNEVLDVLKPQPGEAAVDCTLGAAGHARALLERLGPAGLLLGFDLDPANVAQAEARLSETGFPHRAFHGNFAGVAAKVAEAGRDGVDLLLADLGMSSMQVDDPARGFSYVREGPLDMRMDPTRGPTAAALLQSLSEADLAQALAELGDEPAAVAIAQAVVRARGAGRRLATTCDLSALISEAVGAPTSREQRWRPKKGKSQWETHPAARTFQALRILVNRELANLQHLLRTLPTLLRPGGRAAIISFHSGEDRLVKAAFKEGLARGLYSAASPEPLRASFAEKQANPRARSAKLRWAVRASAQLPA